MPYIPAVAGRAKGRFDMDLWLEARYAILWPCHDTAHTLA